MTTIFTTNIISDVEVERRESMKVGENKGTLHARCCMRESDRHSMTSCCRAHAGGKSYRIPAVDNIHPNQ